MPAIAHTISSSVSDITASTPSATPISSILPTRRRMEKSRSVMPAPQKKPRFLRGFFLGCSDLSKGQPPPLFLFQELPLGIAFFSLPETLPLQHEACRTGMCLHPDVRPHDVGDGCLLEDQFGAVPKLHRCPEVSVPHRHLDYHPMDVFVPYDHASVLPREAVRAHGLAPGLGGRATFAFEVLLGQPADDTSIATTKDLTTGVDLPWTADAQAVYKDVVVYAMFLGFLWFRPQGLMGEVIREKG